MSAVISKDGQSSDPPDSVEGVVIGLYQIRIEFVQYTFDVAPAGTTKHRHSQYIWSQLTGD
jgi:hypothetical protein